MTILFMSCFAVAVEHREWASSGLSQKVALSWNSGGGVENFPEREISSKNMRQNQRDMNMTAQKSARLLRLLIW